jgi:hypothetical protein
MVRNARGCRGDILLLAEGLQCFGGLGVFTEAILSQAHGSAVRGVIRYQPAGGFGLDERFLVPSARPKALAHQHLAGLMEALGVFFFVKAVRERQGPFATIVGDGWMAANAVDYFPSRKRP